MEPAPPDSARLSLAGCLAGPAIGLLIVGSMAGTSALLGARLEFADEWPILLVNVLIVAAPFGLLALAGVRTGLAWLVGLALTLAFWGYVAFDAFTGAYSGANIGLGLIVIASPLIIAFASFAAFAWQRGRRSRRDFASDSASP